MKKQKSIFLAVSIVVLAMALSGCGLFSGKQSDKANDNQADQSIGEKGYVSETNSSGTNSSEEDASGKLSDSTDGISEPTGGSNQIPAEGDIAESFEEDFEPAPDFTLYDQYGDLHTLSDYRGKVVFLNIWATWCPPCRAEMPDIQKLYEEYHTKGIEDVVFLGVACPNYGNETDEDGIKDFLNENGYTYPVVMDPEGKVITDYYITAYPTTFMIDKRGAVYGYVTGMMDEDTMRKIIRETVDSDV
ncbi:MAG: TlpA family protein disulfide reductase [Lachnospiraceae bacterium]|nr:TlpA family protein disulfide reductase [Lachnospiraceae bacterium]